MKDTCFLARLIRVFGVTMMLPQLKVVFADFMYLAYVVSKLVIDVTYWRLLSGSLNIRPPATTEHDNVS